MTQVGRRAPPLASLGGRLAAPAATAEAVAASGPLDLVGDVVERAPGRASTRPLPVAGTPFPRAPHRRESKVTVERGWV